MTAIIITEICPACKGTGIDPGLPPLGGGSNPKPCENCNETGVRELCRSEDLADRFDDILDKIVDIKEKVDEIKEVVDGLA